MKAFIFLLTFLFSFNASANQAFMSVDKTQIGINEPFVLTISINKQTGHEPDFEPLKKDFQIISASNYFNTQFINGAMSQKIEYVLRLMPKTEGKITIPQISIGDVKTNSIDIDVLKNAKLAASKSPSIKLETKVEKQSAYVQEEINYSLYIIDSGGVEFSLPTFVDSKDFIIKTVAKPKVEEYVENGKKFRKIKFDYALFPQKSGELDLPIFNIDGNIIERVNINDHFANSFFNNMGLSIGTQKRPIALRTDPQKINIKPAPQSWGSKWWLPAYEVTLTDEVLTTDYKIGEPIKRNIILTAKGVIDTQLPDLVFEKSKDLKQYPQPSSSQSLVKDSEVLAIKSFSHTYIPTTGGEVVLPQISINWFDVKNNVAKIAKLDAKKIYVNGAQTSSQEPVVTQKQTTNAAKQSNLPNSTQNNIYIYVALVVGFFIGLIISKKPQKTNYKKIVTNSKNIKDLEKNLVLWGQSKYANIYNIQDVANNVMNKDFSIAIDNLSKALYSGQNSFDMAAFIKIFKTIANIKNKKTQEVILPKLYK